MYSCIVNQTLFLYAMDFSKETKITQLQKSIVSKQFKNWLFGSILQKKMRTY